MDKHIYAKVFDEIRERFNHGDKITTDEIFRKYGDEPKLTIVKFGTITTPDPETGKSKTYVTANFKEEPDRLYFCGTYLERIYNELVREFRDEKGLNDYMSTIPLKIKMHWGKNYKNYKTVVVDYAG